MQSLLFPDVFSIEAHDLSADFIASIFHSQLFWMLGYGYLLLAGHHIIMGTAAKSTDITSPEPL